MTVDFTKPVVSDAANNGYIVTLENGWPYEVLEVDPGCQWKNLWLDVQAWLAAGNKATLYVPPKAQPINPEMQLNAEIMADYIEGQKQTKKWQDRKAQIVAEQNIKGGL